MGEVYLARDCRLERNVALKVVLPSLRDDPDSVDLLWREAKIASALNHPNILTVYECGEHEGIQYIAAEFVEGTQLRKLIGQLSSSQALNYARQIGCALEAAHAAGIVHRDIKPENIMVRPDGYIKVLDFGLARLMKLESGNKSLYAKLSTEDASRIPEPLMGTINYMSPEQVRGQRVDQRSDIWSWAVTLYEMLAGHTPFEGSIPLDTLTGILHKQPAPACASQRLNRVIGRALAKEPAQRFHSMTEALSELNYLSPRDSNGDRSLLFFLKKLRSAAVSVRYTRLIPIMIGILTVLLVGKNWLPKPPASPQTHSVRSLAVLPMVDRSGGSPQDYFADGITKDLITELGKTRGLPVMSYQAVSPYKGTEKPTPQIARELGVDAVVEGSVSRTEERVSIAVQLMAADPQRRPWARSFSHDIRDVSTLPREVAQAIAGELNGNSGLNEQRVAEPSRPISPELYEMYQKGRYLCTRLSADANNRGIVYLQQVVTQDPASADAFAALAYCYTTLAGLGYAGHAQLFPQAEVAARKAIALDPSSVEGHIALGSVRLWFEWDWHGAQEELELALKLNPSSLEAHREYIAFLTAVGRVDEAAAEAKKAATLDPVSAVSLVWMGCLYVNARRYDEAITAYNKALELDPHFSYANIELAWTYAQKDMKSESRAALERSISLVRPGDELLADAWLAKAYVLAGRRGELSRLAARWETRARQEYISASRLAVIYGDLGENERALHWLTKGMNERSPSMIFIKADPLLDQVRNEPRFQELVRRMNFPP
jgi:serine/threonine protein kinase/Tfp pilus assembly protein PilF